MGSILQNLSYKGGVGGLLYRGRVNINFTVIVYIKLKACVNILILFSLGSSQDLRRAIQVCWEPGKHYQHRMDPQETNTYISKNSNVTFKLLMFWLYTFDDCLSMDLRHYFFKTRL